MTDALARALEAVTNALAEPESAPVTSAPRGKRITKTITKTVHRGPDGRIDHVDEVTETID